MRQAAERPPFRGLSRRGTMVERIDPAWALYLLEHDFYGWPVGAQLRTDCRETALRTSATPRDAQADVV